MRQILHEKAQTLILPLLSDGLVMVAEISDTWTISSNISVVWSSDIRSFGLYGQFKQGQMWTIYPEPSVLLKFHG